MNATLQLLRSHKSIRKFNEEPLSDAVIAEAVRAGQAASTSSAVQAYSLLQVTDPAKLDALVTLTGGQTKVARCGAFFVVCGDMRRHQVLAAKAEQDFQSSLETYLVAAVDASLFAQNLCVAFESMGYGICYIGGLRNQLFDVDELLNLPHGVLPLYGLCVGTPAESPSERPRLPVKAVWFKDAYPDDQTMLDEVASYDHTYSEYMERRGAGREEWSSRMVKLHATPGRADLADYYRSKGARLE